MKKFYKNFGKTIGFDRENPKGFSPVKPYGFLKFSKENFKNKKPNHGLVFFFIRSVLGPRTPPPTYGVAAERRGSALRHQRGRAPAGARRSAGRQAGARRPEAAIVRRDVSSPHSIRMGGAHNCGATAPQPPPLRARGTIQPSGPKA